MPRYWRDPDDDTVHLSRPGCPIDEFDVIVLPLDQWRRLVADIAVLKDCGANFFASRRKGIVDDIDSIIASVEVPDGC